MSSWFDAKQFTSYAKTALNEAQKTLDKALDIKDEENEDKVLEEDNKDEEDRMSLSSMSSLSSSTQALKAVSKAMGNPSNKMWGSFTGSFFDASQIKKSDENQEETEKSEDVVISSQPFSKATSKNVIENDSKARCDPALLIEPAHSTAFLEETTEEDLEKEFRRQNLTLELEDEEPNSNLDEHGFTQSQLLVAINEEGSSRSSGQNETVERSSTDKEEVDLDSSMSSSNLTVTTNEQLVKSESSNWDFEPASEEEVEKTVENENVERNPEEEEEEEKKTLASMINEAMVEQSEKRSETSSSKSYEVVKNESHPTSSGHTSGDEFETTTTSSDIEVIGHSPVPHLQSPNGKQLKLDSRPLLSHSKMGHNRTGSELSTAGSEESSSNGFGSNSEMERLLKKISDLNEVLEIRETKLVEMSRNNLELQEKNTDLCSQVKEAKKINAKLNEQNISSEDFTQRLSSLEKKLQKALAEKETLTKENKKLAKDSSGRMSQNELAALLKEKEEIISDLRHEGESLSKQVGKHSEIIKKLRNKEKSNEKEIKSLKKELEEVKAENERTNKILSAKDQVESKQIEAITNLTNANSKWEEEHNKVKSDLEDAQEKVNSLKTSLESAYKEIAELKRGLVEKEGEAQELALSKEMAAKRALQDQLRELQEETRKEKDNLFAQIDELRSSLSGEERAAARREDQLRRERDDLMARLEQSENRHEELSGSVSAATRPLLRQIESLQANLNEAQGASERVERSLSERLQQASIQLAAAQERERTAAEQYIQVSSKTASLESKLNTLVKEKTGLEVALDAEAQKRRNLEAQSAKSTSSAENLKRSFAEEIDELKRERDYLEASLETEKCELASERRKNLSIAEQLKDRDKRLKEIQTELDLTRSTRTSSPSPSLGQLSMNGSVSEGYTMNPWPDDVFDTSSVTSRGGNLYDSMRQMAPTTALLENLQSQLKLREGELTQMQIELSHVERSKGQLTAEVSRLNEKAEKVDNLEEELTHLKDAFVAMEQKYQTMLTMYGEKVEEAEELKLDLSDVKEMYKTQIQELIQSGRK